MQLGAAFKEGLQVLVLGLGITLLALTMLIVIIEIINKVINKEEKSSADKAELVEDIIEDDPEMSVTIDEDKSDDGELVAVISAAISMMLEDGHQPFRIKKITQIPANTPRWNQASRSEQLLNRR